jgi:hypothetical protein
MVAREMDRVNEGFQHALERPQEVLQEYPVSSMLVMFGLGLGVGLLVSQALCSTMLEPEPTMTERWQRNLMHAADRVLPSGMSRQLHHYAS